MSRSYRKTPIFGMSMSDSEKKDKRIANRRFRRHIRQSLDETTDVELPDIKELSDPWNMTKDGRRYHRNHTEEDMRK